MNEIEVICEIGVNHGGDPATALRLVNAAAEAGADTVKFQLWNTEQVYPRERWEEMKRLELSRDQLVSLKKIAEGLGLQFLCTPDTIGDAQFLRDIGCPRIKIGSSNVTNLPLLDAIGQMRFRVVMSTGACTTDEILKAADCFYAVTLLHCVSAYPAPIEQLNLKAMRDLWKVPSCRRIGFSDHTFGETAALVALGLGGRTFEKHMTLHPEAPGPDHAASATPAEFRNYVVMLREGAVALGDSIKRIMPCEVENRAEYMRFVAAQEKTT